MVKRALARAAINRRAGIVGRPSRPKKNRVRQRQRVPGTAFRTRVPKPLAVEWQGFGTGVRTSTVVMSEYLDEIPCPCDIYSFRLNPGLSGTFGWLSRMASLYEKYRVDSMVFSFKPAVAATHSGMFEMAIDYDPLDPDPSSVMEMEMKTSKIVGTGREMCSLSVDVAQAHRGVQWLYTRAGGDPSHTTDFGKLILYASGAAADTLGRIYVSYKVTFSSPTMEIMEPEQVEATTDHARHLLPYHRMDQPFGEVVNNLLVNKWLKALPSTIMPSHVWRRNGSEMYIGSQEPLYAFEVKKDFQGRINMTMPGIGADVDYMTGRHWKGGPGLLKLNPVTNDLESAGDSAESIEVAEALDATPDEQAMARRMNTWQDVILKAGEKVVLGTFAEAYSGNSGQGYIKPQAFKIAWEWLPQIVKLLTTAQISERKYATPKNATSSSSSSSSTPQGLTAALNQVQSKADDLSRRLQDVARQR